MGRDVHGDIYFEWRVTDFLEQLFRDLELRYERFTVDPQRDNILTAIGTSDDDAPLVLWEVHQDTVPIDGMTIEPFGAVIESGRIYGRGACDIKGGMSSMLTAVSLLADKALPVKLVLACTVNEEHGFSGAAQIQNLYRSAESKLLPRRPDAIIVSEPTELNAVVAHKGAVRWRIETHGVAGHSSSPDDGDNAIYRMAEVVTSLESYAGDVVGGLASHPRLTPPTLSVGMISGGLSVNTIPPSAEIAVDRRVLPGESPSTARQHVIDHLSQFEKITHHPPDISTGALSDECNGQLAGYLTDVLRPLKIDCKPIGVPYGTDAATLSDGDQTAPIPTVVFGPGSIEQAHREDEWVAIEQLEQAVEALCAIAINWPT